LCGSGPISASIAYWVASLGCLVSNICFARYLLGMPIMPWLRTVFVPLWATVGISGAIGSLPHFVFTASFLRVCITTLCTLVAFLPLAWFVVLSKAEREGLSRNIMALRRKFQRA